MTLNYRTKSIKPTELLPFLHTLKSISCCSHLDLSSNHCFLRVSLKSTRWSWNILLTDTHACLSNMWLLFKSMTKRVYFWTVAVGRRPFCLAPIIIDRSLPVLTGPTRSETKRETEVGHELQAWRHFKVTFWAFLLPFIIKLQNVLNWTVWSICSWWLVCLIVLTAGTQLYCLYLLFLLLLQIPKATKIKSIKLI